MSPRKSSNPLESRTAIRASAPRPHRVPSRNRGVACAGSHAAACATRRTTGSLFEALVALQARLRAPNGCPWDREQTHQTLRTYLIEETYEVLDAARSIPWRCLKVRRANLAIYCFASPVFHAGLAAEAGRISISATSLRASTIRWFAATPTFSGDVKASTSAQVLKNWEQLKAQERRTRLKSAKGRPVQRRTLSSLLPHLYWTPCRVRCPRFARSPSAHPPCR